VVETSEKRVETRVPEGAYWRLRNGAFVQRVRCFAIPGPFLYRPSQDGEGDYPFSLLSSFLSFIY
jgi:hypothetical protein